jgi:hypothetical protein
MPPQPDSVVGTRGPISGGHKKGVAGSLPPLYFVKHANNCNQTDLRYHRENREGRDPPPLFYRLNVVGTSVGDQD